MKVSLYLEFRAFLGGRLYKNIGTGLLSSYKNQKLAMDHMGVSYTEGWDDSCDILQINTPFLYSIYLMKKARRKGKKVTVWAHLTAEEISLVFRFVPLVAPLLKKYLTYAYGLADLIFAPTEYTRGILTNYGLSANKIVVRSNAVNLKKFYKSPALRKSGRAKFGLKSLVVGTAALVIPRKGMVTFLDLAKIFPDNQFVWFGNKYSSLIVEPLPKNLPPNSSFPGFVEQVNEALNSMDIFLFPSKEENEGMAILEAAAVGLPILVRDIPVYQGWLKHGVNCLKASTDEEFEKYLKELIENKSLREKLGQNAKILAQEKSLETIAPKTLLEYEKLLLADLAPQNTAQKNPVEI